MLTGEGASTRNRDGELSRLLTGVDVNNVAKIGASPALSGITCTLKYYV